MCRVVCFLTAVFVAAGCAEKLPPTANVAGVVTLDGKNLTQGRIVFYPVDRDGASPVVATVEDGRFAAPVIPVGRYKVAFSTEARQQTEPPAAADSSFGAPALKGMAPKDKAPKHPIPEKYRTPSLPVEVTADDPNLKFELTSK